MVDGNKAQKSKSKAQMEQGMAALDANDEMVPANPSLFTFQGGKKADEFAKLFSEAVSRNDFKVGDVVSGRVVEVQDDYVLVDINYKSEGLIPISEFRVVEGVRDIKIGNDVQVYIDKIENENGMIVLSKD